jgi:hypothetical protein
MRRPTTAIALLVAAAALLFALLPVATPPAEAAFGSAHSCNFYSDSTHTHQVGNCIFGCNSVRCTGTQTNYSTCTFLGNC